MQLTPLHVSLAEVKAQLTQLYLAWGSLQKPISLHEKCARLTRKKIRLQHSIDSFTYPILTLPTEITCEFFVYCLPDPPTLADKTIAPMLLMRVCRQWRQIALNEPRLWASLKIDSRTGVPCIVQDWLPRARSVPQSLVVQGCGGDWDCLTTCIGKKFSVEQVLELLRRARHLIHCELIDVDESGRLSPIHHTPLLQSHLESLVVRGHETCGGVSGYDLHNSHLLHGLHAPALRILDLGWSYFYHVHTSESSLLTFLEHVQTIQYFATKLDEDHDITNKDIFQALQKMPSLTHLKLESRWVEIGLELIANLLDPHFLPRIQKITLIEMGWDDEFFFWEADEETELLVGALNFRAEATSDVAQLLEFTFILSADISQIDPELDDALLELRGKGMKIHVGHADAA